MSERDQWRQFHSDLLRTEAIRLRALANKHRRALNNVATPLRTAAELLDKEADTILNGGDKAP